MTYILLRRLKLPRFGGRGPSSRLFSRFLKIPFHECDIQLGTTKVCRNIKGTMQYNLLTVLPVCQYLLIPWESHH